MSEGLSCAELEKRIKELEAQLVRLKGAEEALGESQRQLATLMSNLPGMAYRCRNDPNWTMEFVSEGCADLTGYQPADLIGNRRVSYAALVHPQDREAIWSQVQESLDQGRPFKLEYRIITAQGQEKRVWEQGRGLISPEGELLALEGFITDITERKRLEAQLVQAQKMEAVGTLAGGIAHDFNNLLMGVQGNISLMLLETDPSSPNYEKLKNIEHYVHSGAELTKQLLGFARAGKYEVTPCDPNEIVEKSSQMFGRTRKEIRIHEKYEPQVWAIEADRSQIEQVLLNLYLNAWQAMPGSGDLYLATENVTLDESYVQPYTFKPGNYVKISVTDTGVGMDADTRRKVFEPFFTTQEMGRGFGLGLASAYGIVKNHGGLINVYSEKGAGTTFTIYLPASDRQAMPEREPPARIDHGEETVLLVDDEQMIVDAASQMLQRMGYRVLAASGGRQALDIYRENRAEIDIVILDMIMPAMSGGETFDRLRRFDPQVRVLLSSGYSINGQASRIMERGCDGFIQKPFNMTELSQKIRAILGREEDPAGSQARAPGSLPL